MPPNQNCFRTKREKACEAQHTQTLSTAPGPQQALGNVTCEAVTLLASCCYYFIIVQVLNLELLMSNRGTFGLPLLSLCDIEVTEN